MVKVQPQKAKKKKQKKKRNLPWELITPWGYLTYTSVPVKLIYFSLANLSPPEVLTMMTNLLFTQVKAPPILLSFIHSLSPSIWASKLPLSSIFSSPVLSLVQEFPSLCPDFSHGFLAFSSPSDVNLLWTTLHASTKLFYDNEINQIVILCLILFMVSPYLKVKSKCFQIPCILRLVVCKEHTLTPPKKKECLLKVTKWYLMVHRSKKCTSRTLLLSHTVSCLCFSLSACSIILFLSADLWALLQGACFHDGEGLPQPSSRWPLFTHPSHTSITLSSFFWRAVTWWVQPSSWFSAFVQLLWPVTARNKHVTLTHTILFFFKGCTCSIWRFPG